MAFGLMVTKWRILMSPLPIKLGNLGMFMQCIARLHNFCIDQRSTFDDPADDNIVPMYRRQYDGDYRSLGYIPSDISASPLRGHSFLRQELLQQLDASNLVRPHYNQARQCTT